MIFRREHGAANVATAVEHTTRYTVLFRNNDRRSKPIMDRLHRRARAPARRGEAQSHLRPRPGVRVVARAQTRPRRPRLARTTPRRRGPRPTVENTNGRLRRHLPRDTDVLSPPNRDLGAIQDRLNATPPRCLGFRPPAEAFRDEIAKAHPPA